MEIAAQPNNQRLTGRAGKRSWQEISADQYPLSGHFARLSHLIRKQRGGEVQEKKIGLGEADLFVIVRQICEKEV